MTYYEYIFSFFFYDNYLGVMIARNTVFALTCCMAVIMLYLLHLSPQYWDLKIYVHISKKTLNVW